ncbi:hypothetical protein BU069_09685 [Staphylococcus succinus]|nr:hypothetical protein BU069_09685 [Staphylococcus succinus]
MKKAILLVILIIIPLSILSYNDSQYSPYNKDIDKINHARMIDQVKQNDDGMKEADHLKDSITSQKNYDNQLIVSIFLPLLVLVLSDISRDKNERKKNVNLRKKLFYILKHKIELNFKIIESNGDLSQLQQINYIEDIHQDILNYYKSDNVFLNKKQLKLLKNILNNFYSLIYNYDLGEIENLKKNLNTFLDSEEIQFNH